MLAFFPKSVTKDPFTLFRFDISLTSCNGGYQELIKRGTVRISIELAVGLPNTITVIAYTDFDNYITIDKTRSILDIYY